jgi:hypothetical protein
VELVKLKSWWVGWLVIGRSHFALAAYALCANPNFHYSIYPITPPPHLGLCPRDALLIPATTTNDAGGDAHGCRQEQGETLLSLLLLLLLLLLLPMAVAAAAAAADGGGGGSCSRV